MAQAIVPRNLDVDFSAVPRYWLGNSPVATAISNGVNMLFPHGERFFVRSVKYFLDKIDDPTLRQQIKGFFGQEGRHAHAHDEFNEILRGHGYEIDQFLESYRRISMWLEERTPPKVRLAATAAAEHFTAIMAEGAFTRGALDSAAPEMQQLLAWHAAEEIEHKAVAFDVLQKIDPSYRLRVIGLVYATVTLAGFWIWGSVTLMRQDGLRFRRVRAEMRELAKDDPILKRVFLRGIREYLRRDFHPNQKDDGQLAARWFAEHGMSLPEAA